MTYFRIFSADGTHVATVREDLVELELELANARRELDVDGNPIGEARAEEYAGYVAGAR